MKKIRRLLWPASAAMVLLGIAALLTGPALIPQPARADQDDPKPDPGSARVLEAGDGLKLELTPPAGTKGRVTAAVYTLDGTPLGQVSDFHAGKPVQVRIPALIDPNQPWRYYVEYRFGQGPNHRHVLAFLEEQLETRVIGHSRMIAGTRPVLRVLATDRSRGEPIENASVTVELKDENSVLAGSEGKTDSKGHFDAELALPKVAPKSARLEVKVKSVSESIIVRTVQIEDPVHTLLTTDKPLYQPGQIIEIRSLSLGRSDRKPLGDTPVLFEVEDSKGNKVFKQPGKTDRFGISSCRFQLASELNLGRYTIRAIVGDSREEKTVTVDRYVLPKFKVKFDTDRSFYKPGQKVTVDVQADYFFGKPVAGGDVRVVCSKFDVAYDEFKTVTGKLDDSGHYQFELTLPDHFVGQPLQEGKASVKFDVEVTDTADHDEKLTRNVIVTDSPILVAAIPESGRLIPGMENRVHIVTTTADGKSVSCQGSFSFANTKGPAETDAAGFGRIVLSPTQDGSGELHLRLKDKQGNQAEVTVKLSRAERSEEYLLLRTDRSLYDVGDRMELTIHSTGKTGTVYVDVIRDGQTWLTRTLELEGAQASTKLDLEAGLSGTVQINAWMLQSDGVMVRDRRIVMVDPANDLNIKIAAGRETYLPGEPAQVNFHVTDADGNGVPAALCVMVVDEAVYALQEMQPGLEKVYFYLEREIAKPRYEVHGWDLEDLWGDDPQAPPIVGQPRPAAFARREQAAGVLLASAAGAADYSLDATDFKAGEHLMQYYAQVRQAMNDNYSAVQQALTKYSQDLRKAKKTVKGVTLATLVEEGYLKKAQTIDPWGNAIKFQGNTWCQSCQTYHGFFLASAGPDGKWGTADDIDPNQPAFKQIFKARRRGLNMLRVEEGAMADGAIAMPAPAVAEDFGRASGPTDGEGAGEKPAVRVRDYFPETLLFSPALITDANGQARLSFDMADSITTWRMSVMGNSAGGALGSTSAGLRVFQDFFVDIDFPVSLTQNDIVHVPVVVYNYLQADQTVRLTIQRGDWFELEGKDVIDVKLAPDEVKAVHVPVTVREVGHHRFQVTARGTDAADAVARSVQVEPDGKERRISYSGRLEGDVSHELFIPGSAIPGASRIVVKVYPGVLSQVVEGLDSILRMPSGCFEQTSSTTYPNVLVMDYMKTTGKISPELQMKAEGFINAGYQRLLSFECKNGGFEWFGNDPAHPILTAYGLMEFHDMSKVHEVDPAVIQRTQQWLIGLQGQDGAYKPTAGGIQEGAINKFTDDTFRNTAYITWALAQTGSKSEANGKALAWMKKNAGKVEDNYTLALACNAFVLLAPNDSRTGELLNRLENAAVHDGQKAFWNTDAQTPTCGTGDSADIETTALAVQALLHAKRSSDLVSKAITYLAGNKDSFGTWQTTQATIQAMRAMILGEKIGTKLTTADVAVKLNGKVARSFKITPENSDVMQLIDLGEPEAGKDHDVQISFDGEGSLMYQVVGRFYEPHPLEPIPVEPIHIGLKYDRTQLETNDIVTVTATVRNNRPGAARMVVVDLGLPPGFTLKPQKLEKMVENGRIEKFSVTGRQIIVYLRELVDNDPIEIKYQLLAKYPLKAKTPASAVYEYYNPKIRANVKPIELTVKE